MPYIPLSRIRNASKNVGVVHGILSVFSAFGPPSRLRRLRRTPSFARPAIRSHGRPLSSRSSVLLRGFAGYGGHHPSHGLPSVVTAGRPCEGWWRWRESNPRPKRLWPNIYARSAPLVSERARRRTGLSLSIRSVVRGPDARAERFRPSPAELCHGGLAGVCRATSGPMLGRESVIVVRDYGFAG